MTGKTEKKSLIDSTLSLFLLQIVNYAVPIVILPILLRRLGLEGFGVLSFILGASSLLKLFCDYGFDYTATNYFAINKTNLELLKKKFLAVIFSKLVVCILSGVLYFTLAYFSGYKDFLGAFIFAFFTSFFDCFIPNWYFIGLSKARELLLFRASLRLVVAVAVITFVQEFNDILIYFLIEFLVHVLFVLFLYVKLYRKNMFSFALPLFSEIFGELTSSWYVFISKASTAGYISVNIVILGLLTNPQAVGAYSLAEKLFGAIKGLLIPINQAFFPFFSRLYLNLSDSFVTKYKRFLVYQFLFLVFSCVFIVVFGDYIIFMFTGEKSEEAIGILVILSLALPFSLGGGFSSLLVIQKRDSILALITMATMIFNLLLVLPIVNEFGPLGLAYLVLATSIFHLCCHIYANKQNII